MLELEEFARAVRGLAQRNNPRVANHLLQRLHVREAVAGFGSLKTHRVLADPINNLLVVSCSDRRSRCHRLCRNVCPNQGRGNGQHDCHFDSSHFHSFTFRILLVRRESMLLRILIETASRNDGGGFAKTIRSKAPGFPGNCLEVLYRSNSSATIAIQRNA